MIFDNEQDLDKFEIKEDLSSQKKSSRSMESPRLESSDLESRPQNLESVFPKQAEIIEEK